MSSTPHNFDPFDRSAALAARDAQLDWSALEDVMHRDPGGRGLASFRRAGVSLDAGQLRAAALHLAQHARSVAIITGFCAVLGDRVTAETDGPPGALFLAEVLRGQGVDVTLITDRCALAIVEFGCQRMGLPREMVLEFPFDDDTGKVDHWIDVFLTKSPGPVLSHVLSIERPGPSHAGATPGDRGDCHTMRGESIDEHTAPTHRLLEAIARRGLPITTIGIGDGGNELGMGKFARQDLVAAIATGPAECIVCRVATDFTLLAGTSNWGAYALALAVSFLRGELPVGRWLTPSGQQELIAALVRDAGAVDGRTLRAESTVDGLAMDAYLRPLEAMRAIVGEKAL